MIFFSFSFIFISPNIPHGGFIFLLPNAILNHDYVLFAFKTPTTCFPTKLQKHNNFVIYVRNPWLVESINKQTNVTTGKVKVSKKGDDYQNIHLR